MTREDLRRRLIDTAGRIDLWCESIMEVMGSDARAVCREQLLREAAELRIYAADECLYDDGDEFGPVDPSSFIT